MTNKRGTKHALLMSALALLLCVSMLVGSTYAWFTDSVTSTGNKIQSGTLKLDLELLDKETGWNSIKDSNAPIFNYTHWEPGYTDVKILKVENEGTLALKWIAKFVCMEDLTDLAKVIDVYVCPSETELTYPADRNLDGYERVGTVAQFVNTIETTTKGNLEASEVAYLGIALKMQESAGNDYQGMDLGAAFDIQILATQETFESDSFDNQYDINGEYPVIPTPVKVSSANTFAEIADLLAEGKDIYVTENIDLTDKANGNTYLTVNEDVAIYASEGTAISFNENGSGSITVYSGALKTNYELCVTGDATLIIEGGEHSFGAFSATGNGKIVVNGGTLNCRGTYAGVLGVSFAENGQLIVNDGTMNMYQPFNLNANRCDAAYIEINGGDIHLLNGADKLFAVRNIMDKDREGGVLRGSSIKITGGIFTTTYELDDTGDANAFIRNEDGNADTTRVLEFNYYEGEKQYDCFVTGGTFYGSWMRTGETEGDAATVCENTIAGFIADGYKITGDAVNGYVVSAE